MIPVGVLHNTSTGRYHPIVFRPAPLPSGAALESGACRYRSKGHHSDGFATLEEATRYVRLEHPDWTLTEAQWEWDGAGVPAITFFFASEEPKGAVREVDSIDEQLRLWVRGTSTHHRFGASPDQYECCPDFSCCRPALLASPAKRHEFVDASKRRRDAMLWEFLSAFVATVDPNARVIR